MCKKGKKAYVAVLVCPALTAFPRCRLVRERLKRSLGLVGYVGFGCEGGGHFESG